MVKIFSIFLLLSALSFADEIKQEQLPTQYDVLDNKGESTLIQKIKTFLSEESYFQNKDFIKLIFSQKEDYYIQDRVNVVKVAKTLQDNGLLNLFFDKPQELRLSFKTSGSPLFFVKIMGDTLRNIGYYRYVTVESNLDVSEFTWTVALTSEYATDPQILQQELNKSGCDIIDIKRDSNSAWEYTIDMSNGYLNVTVLDGFEEEVHLKRSLYAHWLNVSMIKELKIKSSFRDRWYPYIAYYDKQLHLLKVIKQDIKTSTLSLKIPKCATYIKISDIYTLKNVKDELVLEPTGSR